MGKAMNKKSKPQIDAGKNFPNVGLTQEIEALKTAAVKAQQVVDRSHDALYQVLVDCLALAATYGKDSPEFQTAVRNKSGTHEYPISSPGAAANPYKPVIWQVFKNPPRQTLYRYTSVLSLIETEADEKDIDLSNADNTDAVVDLMKSHGSIDHMVGLVKKKTTSDPKDPAAQKNEWVERIRKAQNSLAKRDTITRVDPNITNVQADGSFSLFAGVWGKDGKINIVTLDAVGTPEDQDIVDIWSAQQKELREFVDIPTAFLADLCKLARAIKEPKRGKADQSVSRSYFRRIHMASEKDCTVANVGLLDNTDHPSLVAKTRHFKFPMKSEACVFRTSSENHEEVLFERTKLNLKDIENAVRCEGASRGKEDQQQGIVGRLQFGIDDDAAEVLLVEPAKITGKPTLGKERKWDWVGKLERKKLLELRDHLGSYGKSLKETFKAEGSKSRADRKYNPAILGLPVGFSVSETGLLVHGLKGKQGIPIHGNETGSTPDYLIHFRSVDLLACIRSALTVPGVESVSIHLSKLGTAKLGFVGEYGDYGYYIPTVEPTK
jgi:hypothetical protein